MVTIAITEIDNIYYLQTIPIYINALIRLSQYKKYLNASSRKEFISNIRQICTKKSGDVQQVFDDIKAVGEKALNEKGGALTFVAGEVVFDEDEVDNDALSFFGERAMMMMPNIVMMKKKMMTNMANLPILAQKRHMLHRFPKHLYHQKRPNLIVVLNLWKKKISTD